MKPVFRKLGNSRGVTILWALAMTAVMLVTGSIILTYASVNLSRVASQQENIENLNTLASGVRLVRSDLALMPRTMIDWHSTSYASGDFDPYEVVPNNFLLTNVLSLAEDYRCGRSTSALVRLPDGSGSTIRMKAVGIGNAGSALDENGQPIQGGVSTTHAFNYVKYSMELLDENGEACATMYLELSLAAVAEVDGDIYTYTVTGSTINSGAK